MKYIDSFKIFEREYSTSQRDKMAEDGKALPDGSYPIADKTDLSNAIQAYGRAKDQSKAAKHIAKRAKELGLDDMIPDTKDFQQSLNENKPKGAPDFHHSSKKVPKAEGRFRDLSIEDLAKWLIKTRDKDIKRISGALTQQINFNKNDDPDYAEKMEKTRQEVYRQLGREDLLDESSIVEDVADGLLADVDDDGSVFDIDIEMEDEEGRSLDDDPEETGDFPDERARPPRLRKKQRKANAVKAKVTRELLGPDSKLRPIINKIFKKIEIEIKKEARNQGVPITNINLDRISIKK